MVVMVVVDELVVEVRVVDIDGCGNSIGDGGKSGVDISACLF